MHHVEARSLPHGCGCPKPAGFMHHEDCQQPFAAWLHHRRASPSCRDPLSSKSTPLAASPPRFTNLPNPCEQKPACRPGSWPLLSVRIRF